jgi:hypothetical protein
MRLRITIRPNLSVDYDVLNIESNGERLIALRSRPTRREVLTEMGARPTGRDLGHIVTDITMIPGDVREVARAIMRAWVRKTRYVLPAIHTFELQDDVENSVEVDHPVAFDPGSPPVLAIGDRVYRLVPHEDPQQTEALAAAVDMVRVQVSSVESQIRATVEALTAETRRRERELEQRLAEAQPYPTIARSDVEQGLAVYRDGDFVCLLAPFWYRPRFIVTTMNGLPKRLPNDLADSLQRQVRIVLRLHQLRLLEAHLVGPDFNPFPHYHGTCWGTYRLPERITTGSQAWALIRDLEALLETINVPGLFTAAPLGMPHVSDLTRAVGGGEELLEGSDEEPEPTQEGGGEERDYVWRI